MNIDLSAAPSIDGLGVKRWRFEERDFVLEIFQRPKSCADARYLFRFFGPNGRMIAGSPIARRDELLRRTRALADRIGKK
jgi:hypothetical protein